PKRKKGQRGRPRKYGRKYTPKRIAHLKRSMVTLPLYGKEQQACLRPRDRFWGVPAPKIDSAFDNLLVPQPSWSPSTTQQLRKLVAAPYLSPNDWTPRLDAYFASPLALCARRVSSAASRLLGSTSLRFALHGWQRRPPRPADSERR
ncbi:hypothetical protein, partial [Thiolapillus sp.]|uniref:hypothetical protein n=1 Tax=Thiolapillus sp. TaxID=2017437 RepID=UPI003AF8EEC8